MFGGITLENISKSINLKDFPVKTFSEFHDIKIPLLDELDILPVAIDLGYGGVKVYGMYGRHIFPSLPIEVGNDTTYMDDDLHIKYKDEYGSVWYIGERARQSIEGNESNVDKQLYKKNRIRTPEYKVLMRVAVFFGLLKDKATLVKNKKIKISTGLPEEYVEQDSTILRDAFKGHHHFEIAVGKGNWVKVSFDVDSDDIEVLSQPFGTIFSMAFNKYGKLINPELITSKNVLVFDGGFHSIDTYLSKIGDRGTSCTWVNYAMYDIYQKTCDDILNNTKPKKKVHVYELDKYINHPTKSGLVTYGATNQTYSFEADFAKNLKNTALGIIRKLFNEYNDFNDIDIVISTGGTGKAFYPYMKEEIYTEVVLAEKTDESNPADNFDTVFSNVIGFFYFMMGCISKDYGKEFEQEAAASVEPDFRPEVFQNNGELTNTEEKDS